MKLSAIGRNGHGGSPELVFLRGMRHLQQSVEFQGLRPPTLFRARAENEIFGFVE